MPPRARARTRSASGPAALSEADVALLRERLESGKKPRVVLLVDTALGAAGTSVPVVSFGDPAVGEYISIRLRDDVVPFSPAELALPVRGRQVAAPTPAPPAAPAAAPSPPPRRPARLVAVPEPLPENDPDPTPPPTAKPTPPPPAAKEQALTPTVAPDPAPAKAPSRKPSRSGGLSVTMRFSGQNWSYESTRGGRRSTSRPLNLAAVRAFADRLDDPSLRRDLQGAIDVSRQQAQARADALRAELERVEVELADLEES